MAPCQGVPGIDSWSLRSILVPARARLSTSTQLGRGGLWQLGARSLAGLQDWLSSAPALPRHAQPGCASRPGMCHACELCHDPEPHHFSTGHQTLPRAPAGAHAWDQQHGRASSLPLLLSSRGQRCQPGPEEQSLLLQLLPPLSPCAKRELLLPDGQLACAGLLRFFTCCVLAVWACPQHSLRTALVLAHGVAQGCRAVPGIHGLSPRGPPPCHLWRVWELWWPSGGR